MSWEEYKKKREEKSSWEQYKEKRRKQVQESKTTNESDIPQTNNPTGINENTNSEMVYKPILASVNNQNINSFLESLSNMNNAQRVAEIKNITKSEDEFNKLNLQVIEYKQSKEAQEKADKINKDINNGNYISAVGHVLSGIPTKAIDSVTTTLASINSLVEPKMNSRYPANATQLLETNKILSNKYEQTSANINNKVVKTASNVSGTIGAMVPSILANIVAPGSGGITQAVNVGASAYQDTIDNSGSNKKQAIQTALAKGTLSYAIERLTGGNFLGKGSLDDLVVKNIATKISGTTAQKTVAKLYEIGGEMLEEQLENQAGYVIDKIINGKNITASQWWNEAGETAKNTFLTTVVLNMLGLGGGTYNEVLNYQNDAQMNKYIKEAEKIIKQENLKIDTEKLLKEQNNSNLQQNIQQKNIPSNNKNQDKIIPIQKETVPVSSRDRLKNAIKDSVNNKTPRGTITLGNVSQKVSEKIASILGINVSNRRHTISKTDIRHMLNEHGNQEIETKKGQIAITEQDILKIPDIIEEYDDIVQGSDNKYGKTIRYIKTFSDNISYVVEVVPENSGTLNIKTMWKKPTALTNSQTTPDSTSKTTDSSISSTINNIIPQNISNMQQKNKIEENLPVKESNVQKNNREYQTNNEKQIKIDSDNFAKQVDAIKKGNFPQRDMLTVLQNTPQVLKDIGLADLPITMTQKHLDTIMNESGRHQGSNYHNLGEDVVKQLPKAISNPLDILKSNTRDDSIILTTYLADKNNNTVIASIKIDGKGKVNDVIIDSNVMTSAYGRNNYEKFMEENIKNGNLLYDIDRGVIKKVTGARLQLPRTSNSSTGARFQLPRNDASINNSIQQNNNNVNVGNTTNYSMQESENNSDSFILPTDNNNADRVATILQKPAEKVEEKDRSWAIIEANYIDKGMVFEKLSRRTGNRELQGKWDYTLTSYAKGQNAIGNARYELDKNTKTKKQISKSLTEIINEVGENTVDFYAYMYHQLNIDRMTLEERFNGDTGTNYERKNPIKNKPVFGDSVTAKMSEQRVKELETKHPEFKEYAQDVYDFLDVNTKELVDNGVISKETQQLFKEMYPHYVPISRVTNKGQAINVPLDTGRTGVNTPIKKAKGGSNDINPLFETMADRTLQTYISSARNSFGLELKDTINQMKQLNQVSEQTDIDTIMENMTDEEQNKQLLQEGKNGANPTFTVFENGNKVTFEISKDMYDALKPKNELLSKIDNNKLSKIANKINNFRRGLLTEYNPVFSITNAIKDSQDILLNSQHSAKTYAKIPEATAQILLKGYWYNEYIQNGGAQNSYFKDGEFEINKNNLPTKLKNTVTIPFRAISNINNIIEMTPRLAEYIVSREQGKSIETSMLDAARVTTNFKAGGDITKTLNRNGFTFLNAAVQGMQQHIRNIQEANAKGLKGYAVLVCKYAIAGIPVLLLNNLIWKDDEEYEELQDYVKDNYYIIGKLSNGNFLRIPKGRAVATIQKIVSNVNDFIKNDSINSDDVGKIFWEDMKENIQFGIDNLAPNNPMENNILSPIFQAITNKTWYGEDLVPTRLQNKPKGEQYDETTDRFSKWLGEKLNISPYKINYVLDQYGGGASDVLLPMMTPQAENNVIEDKFTTNATMKSKYPGEFFTKVDELEVNKNSSKATNEDILKYKYISSVSTDIGKLYTKKREIQNSSATDKEKKLQLKEVQKQINELAKNSLKEVDKIQSTDTTAAIGDREYYKYHNEWTELSEEELKKNKNISLKTYADYKNKVYNQTQIKKKRGELDENQILKNKDKIEILLNSKYSETEISAIYDNYIKSSSDTEYEVMKATGIDIKEYLKYKQQEFTSDTIDDGTLNGKTVSKSKQKKIVDYLNSNIKNGNHRLLLYAMQGYTLTSSQKTQLANYVKELKIDKETKLNLYNKFSGFKVYKDGTVKW